MQNLKEITKRVETIHLVVSNPYTLLSLLLPEKQVYTALDLKDAPFFASHWQLYANPFFTLNEQILREDLWVNCPGLGCHGGSKTLPYYFMGP